MNYGVWGGKYPGAWCHVTMDRVYGTKEEAETIVLQFRKDYPDCAYGVETYDPLKEPNVPRRNKISLAQLKALRILEENPERYWREVRKNTRDSLFDCGLVMFGEKTVRLTALGRSFI